MTSVSTAWVREGQVFLWDSELCVESSGHGALLAFPQVQVGLGESCQDWKGRKPAPITLPTQGAVSSVESC